MASLITFCVVACLAVAPTLGGLFTLPTLIPPAATTGTTAKPATAGTTAKPTTTGTTAKPTSGGSTAKPTQVPGQVLDLSPLLDRIKDILNKSVSVGANISKRNNSINGAILVRVSIPLGISVNASNITQLLSNIQIQLPSPGSGNSQSDLVSGGRPTVGRLSDVLSGLLSARSLSEGRQYRRSSEPGGKDKTSRVLVFRKRRAYPQNIQK